MCVCVHMCANVCVFMYVCGVCVCMAGVHPYHSTLVEVREQPRMSIIAFHVIWNMVSCFATASSIRLADLITSRDSPVSASHHRSTGITGMHCIYIIFISIPISDALWGFDLRATRFRIKCFDHWAISQLRMIFISCIKYCAFFDGNSLPWVYPFQHSILRWVSMALFNRR